MNLTDGQQIWEVEANVDRDKTQPVSLTSWLAVCLSTCLRFWMFLSPAVCLFLCCLLPSFRSYLVFVLKYLTIYDNTCSCISTCRPCCSFRFLHIETRPFLKWPKSTFTWSTGRKGAASRSISSTRPLKVCLPLESSDQHGLRSKWIHC